MKKILLPLAAGLLLLGCSTNKEAATPAKASQSVLKSMADTWTGIIPCADCPGIKYKLTLNMDSSYSEQMRYLEEDVAPFTATGRWEITADSIVTLTREQPGMEYFMFTGNHLKILNQEGKPVTSPLADHYILKRQDSVGQILSGTWRLSMLNKKEVPTDTTTKSPTITLLPSEGKMYGNAGCNRMSSRLAVAADTLAFDAIISTKMACPKMDLEQSFLEALRSGELTFTQKGDRLILSNDQLSMTFKRVY